MAFIEASKNAKRALMAHNTRFEDLLNAISIQLYEYENHIICTDKLTSMH